MAILSACSLRDHARVGVLGNDVRLHLCAFTREPFLASVANLARVSAKDSRAIDDLPFGCSANMCHASFLLQLHRAMTRQPGTTGGYFRIFLTIEA